MFKNFLGRTIQAAQLLYERCGRQVKRPWLGILYLGRAVPGDKQVYRLPPGFLAQQAGEFKTNQSAQAVTEESERFVQIRRELRSQGTDERGDTIKGRLP